MKMPTQKKPSSYVLARKKRRDRHFPDAETRIRKIDLDGFVMLPKTLPLITEIMRAVDKGGRDLAAAYFGLWCNERGDGFVEVSDEQKMAFEAGFDQKVLARRSTEWRQRIKALQELGFIDTRMTGTSYTNILLLNPHVAVSNLIKKYPSRISQELIDSLGNKADTISATDLLELMDADASAEALKDPEDADA